MRGMNVLDESLLKSATLAGATLGKTIEHEVLGGTNCLIFNGRFQSLLVGPTYVRVMHFLVGLEKRFIEIGFGNHGNLILDFCHAQIIIYWWLVSKLVTLENVVIFIRHYSCFIFLLLLTSSCWQIFST